MQAGKTANKNKSGFAYRLFASGCHTMHNATFSPLLVIGKRASLVVSVGQVIHALYIQRP